MYFKKFTSLCDFSFEPGVGLVDFPVEDERVNDAEGKFDENPQIEVAGVVGQGHLNDGLEYVHRLEIGCDYVVALVGTEKILAIVDEISDK